MERIDAVLLEQILGRLPPSGLAAAEMTCRQWAQLITNRQLWQPHGTAGCAGISTAHGTPQSAPAGDIDWRDIFLHRAAASKWQTGKLLLSATLQGHTGATTCIATLQNIVATGASDNTVRLWDLKQGKQLHLLQHAEPVIAVALPSSSLCVTATATAAILWKQGKPIRQFNTLSGGRVACVALTDTRLLIGSTAGAVQHFDIFSGRQQLITRHGSGVTCLLTQQLAVQHFQQQLRQDHTDDWQVIVGTYAGQVSCLAVSTGQILWQLPNKYPSKVVALSVQEYKQYNSSTVLKAAGRSQQQERHCCQQRSSGACPLLYVLNMRSQLICWQLPSSSSSSNLQVPLPSCNHCVNQLLNGAEYDGQDTEVTDSTAAVSATGTAAASNSQPNRHAPIGTPNSRTDINSSNSSNLLHALAVCELSIPVTCSSFRRNLPTCCMCMICPSFGSTCLFVSSSDGFLSIVELQHSSNKVVRTITSSSNNNTAAGSSRGAARGMDNNASHAELVGAPGAQQHQQQHQQQQDATSALQPGQSMQRAVHQAPAGAAGDGSSSSSSINSHSHELQLQLVQQHSLAPLAKAVACRCTGQGKAALKPAADLGHAAAAPTLNEASGNKIDFGRTNSGTAFNTESATVSVPNGVRKRSLDTGGLVQTGSWHLPDAAQITCAVFLETGKLAVGLASGHVCVLKFASRQQQ